MELIKRVEKELKEAGIKIAANEICGNQILTHAQSNKEILSALSDDLMWSIDTSPSMFSGFMNGILFTVRPSHFV